MSMQLLALLKAQDEKITTLTAEVAALRVLVTPGARTAALVQKLAEVDKKIASHG